MRVFSVIQLVATILTASTVYAAPVPALDLRGLVERSDIIVAGTVTAVVGAGEAVIQTSSGPEKAHRMTGTMSVTQTLTPLPVGDSIQFSYIEPDQFIGYRSVDVNTHRILFLVNRGGTLEVTDPYYPSLITVPGVHVTSSDTRARVIEAIVAVLRSDDASSGDKIEAIHTLWGSDDRSYREGLRVAQNSNDEPTRLSAIAALLAANDISVLPAAETVLLDSYPDSQSDLLHNVQVGLAQGIRDERAVPALGRILRRGAIETRRAASVSLSHIHATSAIAPLLNALDDGDAQVRHNAVAGLAAITGQTEWGPNWSEFIADEQAILQHWKHWGASR